MTGASAVDSGTKVPTMSGENVPGNSGQLLNIRQAVGEGFEPPVPCGTPVFKTGAFDHSATRRL